VPVVLLGAARALRPDRRLDGLALRLTAGDSGGLALPQPLATARAARPIIDPTGTSGAGPTDFTQSC
jgi:hypothetical protein